VEVGDLPEAILRASAALAIDPGVPQGWDTMARAHALRGDWARAEETMARAREAVEPAAYLTTQGRMLMWRRDTSGAAEMLASLHGGGQAVHITRALLELVISKR